MLMTSIGIIQRQEFGFGVWTLVTESGETYELHDPPQEICQPDLKVKVEGRVRDDLMSFAAIGPILEITTFEAIA